MLIRFWYFEVRSLGQIKEWLAIIHSIIRSFISKVERDVPHTHVPSFRLSHPLPTLIRVCVLVHARNNECRHIYYHSFTSAQDVRRLFQRVFSVFSHIAHTGLNKTEGRTFFLFFTKLCAHIHTQCPRHAIYDCDTNRMNGRIYFTSHFRLAYPTFACCFRLLPFLLPIHHSLGFTNHLFKRINCRSITVRLPAPFTLAKFCSISPSLLCFLEGFSLLFISVLGNIHLLRIIHSSSNTEVFVFTVFCVPHKHYCY